MTVGLPPASAQNVMLYPCVPIVLIVVAPVQLLVFSVLPASLGAWAAERPAEDPLRLPAMNHSSVKLARYRSRARTATPRPRGLDWREVRVSS